MHHQDRNVDYRQIIVKLGLGQNSDAFILRLDTTHHSLSPPILSNSFGYRRARPIKLLYVRQLIFNAPCGGIAIKTVPKDSAGLSPSKACGARMSAFGHKRTSTPIKGPTPTTPLP